MTKLYLTIVFMFFVSGVYLALKPDRDMMDTVVLVCVCLGMLGSTLQFMKDQK